MFREDEDEEMQLEGEEEGKQVLSFFFCVFICFRFVFYLLSLSFVLCVLYVVF